MKTICLTLGSQWVHWLTALALACLFASCAGGNKHASRQNPAKTFSLKKKPKPAPAETVPATDPATTAENRAALLADQAVATARTFLGTPHRLGGMDKRGIDCSGLVLNAFQAVDIQLPRASADMAKIGDKVAVPQLQRGDLVFFSFPGESRVSHVGLVSEVQPTNGSVVFIHASKSSGVREDQLLTGYWRNHFVGAKRVL